MTDHAIPDLDLPTLDDTQQAVVSAYCDGDHGLYTMNSHPGAGKSTATGKAAALLLYRRYFAGDPTPERRLLVTCFSKEDAADIVPDVVDWLWELYRRDEMPTDESVDVTDVRTLERRLRQEPTIGTVDSVLRSVFESFATEIGFDGMPTVGNEALLTQLRRDCYDDLAADPEYAATVNHLSAAYPENDKYTSGLRELLWGALSVCRDRLLSVDEFHEELRATVADVYDGGDPRTIEAVRAAVARCRGSDTAAAVASLDPDHADELAATDGRLHDAWIDAVDAFCDLLGAYRDRYDELTRERGVLAHVGCAHWVVRYFDGEVGSDARRERVRDRYRSRIQSVIVDEAQDVSTVQHAALSELVTEEMRVLLVGDLKQCIYVWRNARPRLFEQAVSEGRYLGIEWDLHVRETATQNYRSRPGVINAINTVASATLPDPIRGNVSDFDIEYPLLNPTLEDTPGANVHVAQVHCSGTPGSISWVDPDEGGGEADVVASLLAGGVRDKTLAAGTDAERSEVEDDEDGSPPSITVIFRRKRYMDAYADALKSKGFSVTNARIPLFETQIVTAAAAIVEWLIDPTDPERTRALVTDSPLARGKLGLADVAAVFRDNDWSIEAIAGTVDADSNTNLDLDPGQIRVVRGLFELASDLPRRRAEPAAVVVGDIIDTLELEADPLEIDTGTERRQRVANLDALVSTVTEWEGDDRYSVTRLSELLEPFLEGSANSPDRPLADDDSADVVLKTIHQMKGDQDEVIVLADPGFSVGVHPLRSDRLVTTGESVGLAPPVNAVDEAPAIPGFSNGLYVPDASDGGDIGLRWTAEHWVTDEGSSDRLAGYDVLREAAAERRAEAWRLLFVAMSRAQHHFVVPLPATSKHVDTRDHWVGALYEAFEMDRAAPNTTHTVTTPDHEGNSATFDVGVNDVTWVDHAGLSREKPPVPPSSSLAPDWGPWIPRFVRPSTLYPLATDPDRYVVNHFMGRALHTETESVAVALPFDAIGPDSVGWIAHDIVARLAARSVSTADLRAASDPVPAVVDRCLRHHALDASVEERDAVAAYLRSTILPQLADSSFWDRVTRAEQVYTGEPLEGVLRVDSVEVEIQGQADFLMRQPDGSWDVEDVKIALADDDVTADRSHAQLAAYWWALDRQVDDDAIITHLTRLGVQTGSLKGGMWPNAVETLLGKFLG